MKKILFGMLLLASPVLANGPMYQQKDGLTQKEFENVYQDIANPAINSGSAKSLSITTATIANLRVTSLSGVTVGKVYQVVQGNTTSTFSTSSSSFVDSNLSASITPTSSSSKVMIAVVMVVNCTGTSNIGGRITIKRGGSNILDASGQGQSNAGTVGNIQTLTALWLDSPATTSATTYTVQAVYDGSGGSCSFGNGRTQSIELMEIGA